MAIEGFGAGVTGGAGGPTTFVTSLNDSGPGSLRAALALATPRIIEFQVSGDIIVDSALQTLNGNLTIDGSTAPNGGVCIRATTNVFSELFTIEASNVLIRHMRFRRGGLNNNQVKGLAVYSPNVAIDHCSVSWAGDDNMYVWTPSGAPANVTFQWCIVSEALQPGGRSTSSFEGSDGVTFHHNLFALSRSLRGPMTTGNRSDVRNNVAYGHWNIGTFNTGFAAPFQVNVVNNYYKYSVQTVNIHEDISFRECDGGICHGPNTFYVSGNRRKLMGFAEDNAEWLDQGACTQVFSEHNFPPVVTTSATQAFIDVLANAGATLPRRDAVDTRIVDAVTNATGVWIDDPIQVGGWPDLTAPTPGIQVSMNAVGVGLATLNTLATYRRTLTTSGKGIATLLLNPIVKSTGYIPKFDWFTKHRPRSQRDRRR